MKFKIHFEFIASLRNFQDLNFSDATVSPISRPQALEIVSNHGGGEGRTPACRSRIFHSVAFKREAQRVSVTMLGYGAHRNLLEGTKVGSGDVDTAFGGVHRATRQRSG
jgi:hypothetical protein